LAGAAKNPPTPVECFGEKQARRGFGGQAGLTRPLNKKGGVQRKTGSLLPRSFLLV